MSLLDLQMNGTCDGVIHQSHRISVAYEHKFIF